MLRKISILFTIPIKLDLNEPAHFSILDYVSDSKCYPGTDTRTIRTFLHEFIYHLTANQIQYRVEKEITDIRNLNRKLNYYFPKTVCYM